MHIKVSTPFGDGFLLGYALGGKLAHVMILTKHGWQSRHIAIERVLTAKDELSRIQTFASTHRKLAY